MWGESGSALDDVLRVALRHETLSPRDIAAASSVCVVWRSVAPKDAATARAFAQGFEADWVERASQWLVAQWQDRQGCVYYPKSLNTCQWAASLLSPVSLLSSLV